MAGLGFIGLGVGYWLLAYGWSQIRSCNAGFFEIGWPGAFKGCNPDNPQGSANGPPPGKPSVGNSNPTGPIAASPGSKNPLQAPPKGASGPARDYNPNQQSRQGFA